MGEKSPHLHHTDWEGGKKACNVDENLQHWSVQPLATTVSPTSSMAHCSQEALCFPQPVQIKFGLNDRNIWWALQRSARVWSLVLRIRIRLDQCQHCLGSASFLRSGSACLRSLVLKDQIQICRVYWICQHKYFVIFE